MAMKSIWVRIVVPSVVLMKKSSERTSRRGKYEVHELYNDVGLSIKVFNISTLNTVQNRMHQFRSEVSSY